VARYRDPSFPPSGAWDRRLSNVVCDRLQPVETLHENAWFALRNRGGYFTVEYHLQHVAVLPVVGGDSIVMVRVKRPVIGDQTLELPAGGIENGENPASAAARELAEETGIRVAEISRFVPMPPIAVSSTRMPKLSYVFRVEVSEQEFATRRPHDNEIHSVERIAVERLPGMMARGEIYVSVPLAILGVFLTSCGNTTLGAT
jgi:8-oxo-dGTP pyrophosphatase MutT (NUDIX family)